MKHLTEYRNPTLVRSYLEELYQIVRGKWRLMEICGGQTHSLIKNGIPQLLPSHITMIHGPGCPVCVTPVALIDKAIALAERQEVILCSFGDMLRVPGTRKSLLQVKAQGADIRILYSPLEAVTLAQKNPDKEVIFFAVGFETTAPANALSVLQAARASLKNYSLLTSHVLVPPGLEAVLSDPECRIDGILAAGHVCAVMGLNQYEAVAQKFQVPVVVTGFEPVDLLQGILMAVRQLEQGHHWVQNQYARVVRTPGNVQAQSIMNEVFEPADQEWRGLGIIPAGGYTLREKYRGFDALKKFTPDSGPVSECANCIAAQILKGIKKPVECGAFADQCTPEHPLGAPMVSSEGACAAYYHVLRDPVKEMVP